jgi:nucleoid DNA-binding protein
MELATYISDLLYRYECVIVPEFGGFVTTLKSTVFNAQNNTFYPPSKAISFNANLTHNDGLLANYIAKAENISYTDASNKIKNIVSDWKKELHTSSLFEIDKIGSFTLNSEGKIVFDPQRKVNYLTASYGLSPLVANKVGKEQVPVIALNHQTRPYLKYAAIFVLGLSTIGFGNKFYQEYRLNQQVQFAQEQQQEVQNKIQSATFTISNPLPSITLHNTYISNNFYVVAGAFREPLNAEKKLKELKAKGFDAAIIGKNKWQLTQVVFGSYPTKEEATKALYKIRATQDEDAWLLVKKQ